MAKQISMTKAMRKYIEPLVRGGAMGLKPIVERTVDLFGYEYDADKEDLLSAANDVARKVIEAHIAKQATWPKVTDCNRLTKAFKKLDKEGILCRENFSCCTRCGHAQINEEIEERIEEDKDFEPFGYAFYHEQDVESAVESNEICIAFGSWDGDDAADCAVGRKIVQVISAQGLQVDWDETAEQRIMVSLDWKRRWARGAPRRKPQR